ncbi:ABC transporter permease [Microbacterium sp. cf332]|uniref:ABC transporter permease n=1 Tax=Microbacterium sp. cf332 TaxID=1761804 RepID=UPI00088CB10B|nr:ABC transporter permease [Microbacterium sp. cf332]SDQ75555.1 ABC-type transport system involved in multi-copper enzyme maturation, permease component [Microbacterium sp. cf332]
MSIARLWTVARLELLQRIRTVSWYVLLGIFAVLLIGVTALSFLAFGGVVPDAGQRGAGIYSTIVIITLLLVVLVSPTLSGNSINGDRDAATLAPVQVTFARTSEILLGKVLAAWITGLAFAAVAAPFLIIATLAGGVDPGVVVVSLLVLIVEIGVIAAIGVGLSGIIARPLFSVAATYLVVSALVFGTLIAFGLGSTALSSEATTSYRPMLYNPDGSPQCRDGSEDCWNDPAQMVCGEPQESVYTVPRFDRVWWVLAANPFVILADATPAEYDPQGYPIDLFGQIASGVRQAQLAPDLSSGYDECAPNAQDDIRTPAEIRDDTVPSWFVGLGVQVILAGLLVAGAWARTRTPARALPPGTRIA